MIDFEPANLAPRSTDMADAREQRAGVPDREEVAVQGQSFAPGSLGQRDEQTLLQMEQPQTSHEPRLPSKPEPLSPASLFTTQSDTGLQGDRRFELLTQALPQLIWWSDERGETTYVTSRTLAFFGVGLDRLEGTQWTDFVHPEDRTATLENWRAAIAEQRSFEVEHRLFRSDGQAIHHLEKALPIFDSKGILTGYLRTSTDISAQKQTEIALRQAEKLAAVGKLAFTISHEINNPLESVSDLLYLLAGHGSLDRTAREYVRTAQEELARISEITRQTLQFNNRSSKLVMTRVPDVLDSVLAFYKPRILAAGLHLMRDYHGAEPLLCFPGEIRQALANIIGNAIEATPRGGRLRVRLRASRDWKTQQRSGVRITIADTGRGISEEHQSRIYEPFFTTKGLTGTGLGLSITRDLIARHDGTMSLRSRTKPGHSGTVLSLFLPFEAAHLTASEKTGSRTDLEAN